MSCACCSHMISFPPRSNITLPAQTISWIHGIRQHVVATLLSVLRKVDNYN